MDDGAKSVKESLAMLRMEADQGIDNVVLTPHFSHRDTVAGFLEKREKAARKLAEAIIRLPENKQRELPKLFLGAEVEYTDRLFELQDLEKLCYADGKYLLIELPFMAWRGNVFTGLSNFANMTGLTPVIAHVDRYFSIQNNQALSALCDLGFPMQISTDAVLHALPWSRSVRFLKSGKAGLVVTDCHDQKKRQPNLGPAMKRLEKLIGPDAIKRINRQTDEILLG